MPTTLPTWAASWIEALLCLEWLRRKPKLYLCGQMYGGALEIIEPNVATGGCVHPPQQLMMSLPEMPFASAAVLCQKIHICGGTTVDHFCFDPSVGLWEPRAPLHTARRWACAVVIQEKLYVCGGFDGANALASVEIYDPATDTWSFGPPLLQPRTAACAAALGLKLYICGGNTLATATTVEIFDYQTNTWSLGPPLTVPRGEACMAVHADHIYVCGGRGIDSDAALNSVERLEGGTVWQPYGVLESPRRQASAVSFGEQRLLVACGCDYGSDDDADLVFHHDIETLDAPGEAILLPRMPERTPRCAFTMLVL